MLLYAVIATPNPESDSFSQAVSLTTNMATMDSIPGHMLKFTWLQIWTPLHNKHARKTGTLQSIHLALFMYLSFQAFVSGLLSLVMILICFLIP